MANLGYVSFLDEVNLDEYDGTKKLKEDEYLLKVVPHDNTMSGFLTKLTQKNEIPVSFKNWNGYGKSAEATYLIQEEPREGWKIAGYRFGKSQNWARMRHPFGFTIEIHMTNLFTLLESGTAEFGVLKGKYKYAKNKLIPEK